LPYNDPTHPVIPLPVFVPIGEDSLLNFRRLETSDTVRGNRGGVGWSGVEILAIRGVARGKWCGFQKKVKKSGFLC
jgi:hypothetical protein